MTNKEKTLLFVGEKKEQRNKDPLINGTKKQEIASHAAEFRGLARSSAT